jgi:hypothetical protein
VHRKEAEKEIYIEREAERDEKRGNCIGDKNCFCRRLSRVADVWAGCILNPFLVCVVHARRGLERSMQCTSEVTNALNVIYVI